MNIKMRVSTVLKCSGRRKLWELVQMGRKSRAKEVLWLSCTMSSFVVVIVTLKTRKCVLRVLYSAAIENCTPFWRGSAFLRIQECNGSLCFALI